MTLMQRYFRFTARLVIPILALSPLVARAQSTPLLWLPTPPGEAWQVIQGYACGTHDDWDRYSLDLVSTSGATRGAAVRAAADGTIWDWVEPSGTLLLKHGDAFYTMYTHMERATITERNTFVARGTVIGSVGDRGAPGTPHLHFTAFTGQGMGARQNRRSVPLAFADGYDLKEIGGCNQHGGEVLRASGAALPLIGRYRSYMPIVGSGRQAPDVPTRVARPPRRWPRKFQCWQELGRYEC
jgi:hypothetical protein